MPFISRNQRLFALAAWLMLATAWSAHSATFTIVNQDDPNEGFNDATPASPVGGNTGTTLGQQRLNVFDEAARQWGAILQSSVDIRVQAQFNSLPAGVLGSAGPVAVERDFPNAPVPNTFFPSALANALAGQDLDTNANDINAQFSSDFNFYMGFDHVVPAGQVDLLVVLLHEMGHGLGFLTFVNSATGQKFNGLDDHYMRFLVDEATGLKWPDMSDGQRAGSAVDEGLLQWSGDFAIAAASNISAGNGTLGPRMYAPQILSGGSSVSHYDTVMTPNDLMEPFITSGPQQFMTEALFRDIGWPFNDGGGGPVTLRIADKTAVEGNTGLTMMDFELTLSSATNSAVTVNFTTADGTAIAGSDYVATNGVVTFPANETSATLTILVQTDSVQEPDESFFINLSGVVGVVLGDNQAIGTITDDDGVEAAIADASLVEGNSGLNNMVFTVTLSGGVATQDVSVNYATSDGTATAGSDYTADSGTLIFPPGFSSMNISIPILADALPEPDESFFINITGATNAVISDFQGIGTIINDDAGSVFSITSANLTEQDSGSRDMFFQVSMLPPSTSDITVDYATSDGTATEGEDYTAASGTLMFPAGATSRLINIQILGDTLVESNETFLVTLSNPVGAFINIGQGTGTIVEDDGGFVSDLVVTRNTNAFDLARAITGSDNGGLTIKEIRLNAHTDPAMAASSGLFELLGEAPHTYGLSDPGIVISTGDVLDYESGISSGPAQTTAFGPAGLSGAPATVQQEVLLDPITTSGVVNFSHFDATQLDIRFDAPDGFNQVSFRISFGSEEFPEAVNAAFSDGFGIYLNGTNIAFNAGSPIDVNHPDMQALSGTELDGVIAQGNSAVLQFNALIQPGSKDNTLTFIIADTENGDSDSTVYISSLKASAPFSAGTAPSIVSVSPLRAPVDADIVITGDNFGATPDDNIVFIGPVQAVVTEASPTSLTVKAPFGASYGAVTVTTAGLTGSSPLPFSGAFTSGDVIDQDSYDPAVNYLSGGVPEDVVVGDLDNDGRPDLIVINFDSDQLSIFRNVTIPTSISAGSFTGGIDLPTLADPSDMAIGDLNGDGLLDLVVVCNGAEMVSVYQNTTQNESISFSPGISFAVGSDPRGVAIGDLDRDGRQDIAVAESGRGFVTVLRNIREASDLGLDSFDQKVDYLVGSIPISVAIGDINGDRVPDMVVANSFDGPGGNTISILRNLGVPGAIDSGTFAVRENIPASSGPAGTSVGPADIQLADMDNDQLLDIVTANSRQPTVSVHLNRNSAPGTFDPADSFSSGLATRRMAIADIDGDHLPDIAVANQSLGALTLLKNTSTDGSAQFTPTAMHALPAQPISVAFADLDQNGKPELVTANSNGSVSVLRNTMRSDSAIDTWNPDTDPLIHGEPLGPEHLNATSTIEGTFIYNPPLGAILPAGMNDVVATFVPDDFINNSIDTETRTITVLKAAPIITWTNPSDIPFNTPLGAAELNASANTPGTFIYTPPAGTKLPRGDGHMLLVNFTPDQPENFNSAGAAALINVVRADPAIVWNDPPDLPFGDPLDSQLHLNATVSPEVDGDFSYTEMVGQPLSLGSHEITATFTPSAPESDNYNTVMATRTINVVPADPAITWNTPDDITFGDALNTIDHLNPSSSIPGTFTFMPAAGTVLNAGQGQTLTATFTPDEPSKFNGATATTQINVGKADLAVTWPAPADIIYGTPLNTTDQLNAMFTPSAATAVYTPAQGAILPAGTGHTLNVTITPDDASNYNVTTGSTVINVLKRDPVISWSNPAGIVFGTPLNTTDHLNATFDRGFGIDFSASATGGADEERFQIFGGGNQGGVIAVRYQFFVSPDQMQVFYDGALLFDTGLVSNPGAPSNPDDVFLEIPFPSGVNNFIEIVMNPGGSSGEITQWNFDATVRPSLSGVAAYTPGNGAILDAGPMQQLDVTFTPADTANYNEVSTSVHLEVTQAPSVIAWDDPADIVFGTLLNGTDHLNATANTEGTFAFTPDVDFLLSAGDGQILSVTFTPDSMNFSGTTATAAINVLKADPVITWNNPDDIPVGTPLSGTQLNATAGEVMGDFAYTPASGEQLLRGFGQTLSTVFTPSGPDAANFNNATAEVAINVVKADPVIVWTGLGDGVFPFTLGGERLNATELDGLPGMFNYTPAAGTSLNAGDHTLSVTFTPDSGNYNVVTETLPLTVNKANAAITWENPEDIVFGTLLDATQLNATSAIPGAFVYDPPAGALLNAETGKRLMVTFTPQDQLNYNSTSVAFVDLNILKADPAIVWNAPDPIQFGTGLGASQLNASADVPGEFSYTPDFGALLEVGDMQPLLATFTPDDEDNYNHAPAGTLIDVHKGEPELVWNNPADIVFGTALSGVQLNAQTVDAGITGQFVYTPAAAAILNAGAPQTLSVTFTPDNMDDYVAVTKDVSINVLRDTPIVDWRPPADIAYETPLSATQLNATADIDGFFSYAPPIGAILDAGTAQVLRASFTPTDSGNYDTVQLSTVINVSKLAPSLTWNSPASLIFGAPLTSAQLNAVSDVDGEFAYTPPAGTTLNAGVGHPLQAQFTPSDTENYETGMIAVTIDITPADPVITWANPADIVFGQALKNLQLNATADVPGDFDYDPPLSTILNAGPGQPLNVTFTPDDNVNYSIVTALVHINVLKADPVLTWANPAGIVFGAALGATQLNAMHDIPGSFSYTPPAGAILNAGEGQSLTANFTPDDPANFNGGTISVSIDVAKADPVIAWNQPAPITFGSALTSAELNAATSVAGIFTYSPPAGSVLSAGDGQPLNVQFTPANGQNYANAFAMVTIDVLQAASSITWSNPADIVAGSPLTSAQLNATANVSGSFLYSPGLGAVLSVGDNQILSVQFNPSDSINFSPATAEVQINVAPSDLPPTVTIINPRNNGAVIPLSNLTIVADASDDNAVAKVEFFEGANKLGESLTPPYTVIFPTVPLGSYSLTAVATDNAGLTATSATVNISAPPSPTDIEISPTTGEITVGLVGEDGIEYDVQVSSDLRTWQSIGSFTGTGGQGSFEDSTIAGQVGQRFYRLIPIP